MFICIFQFWVYSIMCFYVGYGFKKGVLDLLYWRWSIYRYRMAEEKNVQKYKLWPAIWKEYVVFNSRIDQTLNLVSFICVLMKLQMYLSENQKFTCTYFLFIFNLLSTNSYLKDLKASLYFCIVLLLKWKNFIDSKGVLFDCLV